MSAAAVGLTEKGEKHHRCRYFVLDMTHDDQHVRKALSAYAESIHRSNPTLASDLRQWLINGLCGLCGGAGCDEGCGRCEMAYAGPDSHKVCRSCHGAGS